MIRSLHSAASGMEAQQLNIDVIANNLANVNTTGFKKARAEFQDLYYQQIRAAGAAHEGIDTAAPQPIEVGLGTRPAATQKIFSTGDMLNTGNPLDVALEGNGFFRVLETDGTVAYTRAGAFKTNAEGQLVNTEGRPLEPPIIIPPETVEIRIDQDGVVKALQPGEVEPIEVGQIELSQFVNPAGLRSVGHSLFEVTEASGPPIDGLPGEEGLGRVAQGMLESSNVAVVGEMIDLIAAQRAYEINSKVIQSTDQMLALVAQLR